MLIPCFLKESTENATIRKIIAYVRELSDPSDVDAIAHSVFSKSSISTEEGATKLRHSVDYYQTFYTSHGSVSPSGEYCSGTCNHLLELSVFACSISVQVSQNQ